MNLLTKKAFLISSLVLTGVFLAVIFLGSNHCYENIQCREIRERILRDYLFFTILFPTFLTFSIITYPLSLHVFNTWKKFALFSVPLVLVLTYLTIKGGGREGFFSLDFTPYYLFTIYGIFFLVSIIIILIAVFRERHK